MVFFGGLLFMRFVFHLRSKLDIADEINLSR